MPAQHSYGNKRLKQYTLKLQDVHKQGAVDIVALKRREKLSDTHGVKFKIVKENIAIWGLLLYQTCKIFPSAVSGSADPKMI